MDVEAHMHIGRAWTGHRLEDECPCPQEPCGLIDTRKIDPTCAQHPLKAFKTIRQGHPADNCPARAGAAVKGDQG